MSNINRVAEMQGVRLHIDTAVDVALMSLDDDATGTEFPERVRTEKATAGIKWRREYFGTRA